MNELPCDTEPQEDLEPDLGPELPSEVTEAAARLFGMWHEQDQGHFQEPVPAGAEEIIREIKVRSINTQPALPRLFQQIAENYNARRAILEKGVTMTQADWRQLKELARDMKKSLRPGAEMFLKQARSDEWRN